METNSLFDDNIYNACVITQTSSISNKINEIIYKQDINLTYNGLKNLLLQIYFNNNEEEQSWKIFDTIARKAKRWSKKHTDFSFIIFNGNIHCDCDNIEKDESIYITNNKKDFTLLAHIFLNLNSIHLLNYGKPDKWHSFFYTILEFRKQVELSGNNLD
jgi:hypothetical protein